MYSKDHSPFFPNYEDGNLEKLPYCIYPRGIDVKFHGLQELPKELPKAPMRGIGDLNFCQLENLQTKMLDEMISVVSTGFAKREPMLRHFNPHKKISKEKIISTFVRQHLLLSQDVKVHSLATISDDHVVGGVFNETLILDSIGKSQEPTDDLKISLDYLGPIFNLLNEQQKESIDYLIDKFVEFKSALDEYSVGHCFMLAKSKYINSDDAKKIIFATVEHFRANRYTFLVVQASNTWVGAVFESLNAVRVHFFPYRLELGRYSKISSDGHMSDKDSGCMFYVLQL